MRRSNNLSWFVSEDDLKQLPQYLEGATLDSMLYALGMDVKRGYQDDGRHLLTEEDLDEGVEDFEGYFHRSILTKKTEKLTCPRYVGYARQDGDWAKFIHNFLEISLV